jgi:hypothetical protein
VLINLETSKSDFEFITSTMKNEKSEGERTREKHLERLWTICLPDNWGFHHQELLNKTNPKNTRIQYLN